MKKILSAVALTIFLFSCNSIVNKRKFTLTGEIKSIANQKIYLEELFFIAKQPEVLDTGEIKNGIFIVSAIAKEEGLYRLRTADEMNSYLFINEDDEMKFTADVNKIESVSRFFSGSANSSLKKLTMYTDSIGLLLSNKNSLLSEFTKARVSETDSIFIVTSNEFSALKDNFSAYCFSYADTSKSPIVSLFAATMAPVEISKYEMPLTNLVKRFPNHKGIAGALDYVKKQTTNKIQTPQQSNTTLAIGDMAPEITMNDVNDNSFSLNQMRGKYVLVDFWASWCAPCRDENPNVVAAYSQFKNKNFTVLGVSLDKNKEAWLNAIKEDELNWQHISDLKYWNSAAVGLYGFDGIPYNVLINPNGKIIAIGLRGNDLINKLAEVLK